MGESVLEKFVPRFYEERVCLKCGRVFPVHEKYPRTSCVCGGTLCPRVVLRRS
jgi:hypothetical protein